MSTAETEREISGLTVRVDRMTCVGTLACRHAAPDVFELDGEGIITFRADVGEVERERLIEACQLCPVDALEVLEGDERLVP